MHTIIRPSTDRLLLFQFDRPYRSYDQFDRLYQCVYIGHEWIIWLEVQRSNKNPKCIAKYFLNHVKAARGCPVRVYTDPGTENGPVAGIQCYLGADGFDKYAGSKSHKYVTSICHQRIECQWSHFRKQRSSWCIDFFSRPPRIRHFGSD